MTSIRLPFLFCDYEDCDQSFSTGHEGETVAATRASASVEGWSHTNGLDLCTKHTQAMTAGKRRRMRVVAINGGTKEDSK